MARYSASAWDLVRFVGLQNNAGTVGQTVRILGQGLTGTSAVSFNRTDVTAFYGDL